MWLKVYKPSETIINGNIIGQPCTQHFGVVSREALLANRGNFSSFIFLLLFYFFKFKSMCVTIPPQPGGREIMVRRLGRSSTSTIVWFLQSQVKVRVVTLWWELEIGKVDILMLIKPLKTYLDHKEFPKLTPLIDIQVAHQEGEENLHHNLSLRHHKQWSSRESSCRKKSNKT